MQNLIKWIKANKNKLHPVELAAIVHHKLAYIHPFWDGNGRVLKILKPKQKKADRYISLEELAKEGPYSANYLRKLATQAKLEAFKEGRNWLSSKRALEEYIDSVRKKVGNRINLS
jgi:fido (protein-threonine AMPylation protein)